MVSGVRSRGTLVAILRSACVPLLAIAAASGLTTNAAAQSCVESCTGNMGVGGDVSGYENCMSRCNNSGGNSTHTIIVPPDPCYIAQNAMRPCTAAPKGLDSRLVGTWVLPLKDGAWTWKIASNGTYKFHSAAKDNAPDHAGTISANHGNWVLTATSGIKGYTDQGTYTYEPPGTLIATGKLGPGTWHRASATRSAPAANAPTP